MKDETIEILADKVLSRLDKVAVWLNETGTNMLTIYTERVVMEGYVELMLAGTGLLTLLVGLAGIMIATMARGKEGTHHFLKRVYENDMEPPFAIVGITFTIIGGIVLPVNLYRGIIHLASPEYTAIHRLLDVIK